VRDVDVGDPGDAALVLGRRVPRGGVDVFLVGFVEGCEGFAEAAVAADDEDVVFWVLLARFGGRWGLSGALR
jgi:hypothetical protein